MMSLPESASAKPHVQYEAVRPQMKSGDVVFFRGEGIIGWIVRLVTKSEYAHIGIVWCVGGRTLVVEADPLKGVICQPTSRRVPFMWAPGYGWNDEAEAAMLEDLGASYDFKDAIRSGFGKDPEDPKKFECAEFVSAVLQKVNGLVPMFGTPREVAAFMDAKMVAVIQT